MTEKEWIEKIKRECVFNIGNFDIKYAIQLKGKPGSNIEYVSINKRFMDVSIIDRAKHRKFYARMKDKDANLEILAEYHMAHSITSKGAKILWEYYIGLYQKYMKTGRM